MTDKSKMKWRKSERFEREKTFELEFPAEKIFPLLCPVLEYDWLPGWNCVMCHSTSGVAEKDAVFLTREKLGRQATWICITYQPDTLVEYLLVSGKDVVTRLSIFLEETSSGLTRVRWRMLFTLCSALSRHAISRAYNPVNFSKFVDRRHDELDFYLRTGKMAGK